ncbi:hypothetical protein NJD73_19980 [Bacillus altitudinis]|uniref:Uncharacterized protein n=1 Tax=Bacillus altitudinis TaxID=293387 RepID=A0A653TGU4_BACAB|nr:hypothetical protein [Bacillus altitudinis]MDX2366756.1 hypothetical protein [Bacillus altitudinis]VXB80603.1 conserved hypothetical protein [Bacillus altitudinis]
MNWLEFWSKLIDSIAWPLAVVILVLILKNKIGQLSSFRYKETEAVFNAITEEVDHLKEVESNSKKSINRLPYPQKRTSKLNMIILSWKEVEAKIAELSSLANHKIDGPGFTMHQIRLLIDIGALPDEIYDSFTIADEMQRKFFSRELPLDKKTIRKYEELCSRLVNIIESNIQKRKSSERPSS